MATKAVQWIAKDELEMGDEIGWGCTAKVFQGTFATQTVAVKRMVDQELALHESKIMAQLDHPGIVKFHGAWQADDAISLVLEFCSGGILFEMLHVQEREISWQQQLKISSDIASAMSHLHCLDPKIVHRDLKSPNVLLKRPVPGPFDIPCAKLCDFGLARALSSEMSENVGTPHWMAPECAEGGVYDEKVDVYSFGVLLFEIICLEPPYEGMDIEQITAFVRQGGRPELEVAVPSDCPASLRALMEHCWVQDPRKRPHFNDILMSLCTVEVEPCPGTPSGPSAAGSRKGSKTSAASLGLC